jgi:hypothetical protein
VTKKENFKTLTPELLDQVEDAVEIVANVLPHFADQTAQLLEKEVAEGIFRRPNHLKKNIII